MSMVRYIVSVKGIVQGVGFRPFVYGLAQRYGLHGTVINTPEGVEIDVEGDSREYREFLAGLKGEAPPLAVIEEIHENPREPAGYREFIIGPTGRTGLAQVLVSPDVAVCQDCLREMFEPGDRRYRYPFINCTNCGPRYTIINGVPYDREYTTMSEFTMCPACAREYHDPANRRFHAQPNACPECGPRVFLTDARGQLIDQKDPIRAAGLFLAEGRILAVKGLGGYHLACNALDDHAVAALRTRKIREDKPFAIMVRDLEEAASYCLVTPEEASLLVSAARPIVLLPRRGWELAEQVAPGNAFIGVMLPYTPLHHLLFAEVDVPLVMTSANMSDEPIAYQDSDARQRLGGIADFFLVHNRVISHRCDDSVTRVYRGGEYLIRRSRGYAPAPVRLARPLSQVLAVGGEQKNTFCLTRDRYALISHHIGDLENMETLEAFEREIAVYTGLFRAEPEIVAYDLHPEYLSTKYALDLPGIQKTGVQHHHAHTVSCMAEHGLTGRVLGVSFDGTGYGPDGTIWGGEFLLASAADYERIGHLQYTAMPGGGKAVREPWRMAAGYLYRLFGDDWLAQPGIDGLSLSGEQDRPGLLDSGILAAVGEMLAKNVNCPMTSSMGRFFDAAAALIGVRGKANYEGQAAIELEQLARRAAPGGGNKAGIFGGHYNFALEECDGRLILNTNRVIEEILADIGKGIDREVAACRFHDTVRAMVAAVCVRAREMNGENRVCLSGGVFQNMLLLDMVYDDLTQKGFAVYIHRLVPANDGGLSLGQALVADERRKAGCV